jgi:hypothetical protein
MNCLARLADQDGWVTQAAEKLFPAVILSEAKNLALPAQDKLREGSRSVHFHGNARFFVGRRGDLLRMTVPAGFPAACTAPRGISCIMSLHAGAACSFRALGGQRALRSAEFAREIQRGTILWHSEW